MHFPFLKIVVIVLSSWFVVEQTTTSEIYSYTLKSNNGQDSIALNDFRGKKILIVNSATSSHYSNQMAALDSLYRLHKDSLVVIACPSNSFGNESERNEDIRELMIQRYHVSFLMSEKLDVKGEAISSLYNWLSKRELNGRMNMTVKNDFYKFMINESGQIIAVFNPEVNPMGPEILDALSK